MGLTPFGHKGGRERVRTKGEKSLFPDELLPGAQTESPGWEFFIQKKATEKDFHRKLPSLFFLNQSWEGHCKMLFQQAWKTKPE